jgi:hypothetical protein
MKCCARCKKDLPQERFRWKNKSKGWRQPYCIDCNIAYNKEHYQKNRADYIRKAATWNKENNPVGRLCYEYKLAHPCVDCGESDPACLEFDHRDRATKKFNICTAVKNQKNWNKILVEIEKCDIRCKNCHAKKTAAQFGWFKSYAPLE